MLEFSFFYESMAIKNIFPYQNKKLATPKSGKRWLRSQAGAGRCYGAPRGRNNGRPSPCPLQEDPHRSCPCVPGTCASTWLTALSPGVKQRSAQRVFIISCQVPVAAVPTNTPLCCKPLASRPGERVSQLCAFEHAVLTVLRVGLIR